MPLSLNLGERPPMAPTLIDQDQPLSRQYHSIVDSYFFFPFFF